MKFIYSQFKSWFLIFGCASSVSIASATSVTFQVNMFVQASNTVFNPLADTVEARGDFNNWTSGFTLTTNLGNPYLYSGTFNCTNVAGSVIAYKFVRVSSGFDNWESDLTPSTGNNRTFNLSAAPQILSPIYFNNLAPTPPVATQPVTFQVDMTVQITNGFFNPLTDSVEVRGTFENPYQWTSGFSLTNSPGNTNLYTGTYADGNYPGTQEAYKFVITNGGGDQWESIVNRPFTVQGGGQTLPAVYFNNQPGTTIPVTFQVDMSVPIASGSFNPATDFVEVRGTFESPQWNSGLLLTNSPGNTNLFIGTFTDTSGPGTVELYKFAYNSISTGYHWEQTYYPTPFGNRAFTLSTNAQTLPVVRFADLNFSDVLPADTVVTFQLNMTNAVGTDGHAFDPLNDVVAINGDFLGWWFWGEYTPTYIYYPLANNPPGSGIYTFTLLFPRWSPNKIVYKYGINGFDNEAPFALNHVRYIRATNNYAMPLDTFGTQFVEASVSPLAMCLAASNVVNLSWNGRPGVHLQKSTNLASTTWLDVPNTDGLTNSSFTNVTGQLFFRLIHP